MPALRALYLLGFLLGTALLVAGVVLGYVAVAIAGAVLWLVGVAVGLVAHRLRPTR